MLRRIDGKKKRSSFVRAASSPKVSPIITSKISISRLSSSIMNRSKFAMSSHIAGNDISDITELSLTYENNTDASSPSKIKQSKFKAT
jgi:hypothetical protein